MAGGPGLDFLDAKLKEHLSRPADTFYDNDDSSVIGLMFELFAKTGTSTWVCAPRPRVYNSTNGH